MDVIYAWSASLASGATPLVIKATSKSLISSPWLFNVLWIGFGVPPLVIYALLIGAGLPENWWSLIALSLSQALFFILYTYSLYKIDVTTMSPLFSLRTVFASMLGIFVLGESISTLGLALILVIVLASPLAAYDERQKIRSFLNPAVLIAIVAMAVLAGAGYFTNLSVDQNGYATTLLFQDAITLLFLLPTLALAPKDQFRLKGSKFVPFIFLAVTGFAYTATSALAYASNLTLSSVIVSLPLSMIFAFVLSKRYSSFLESHPTRVYVVRFIGAGVMVVSALWLSFL
jgi:drug/metabolite transporter (DMT)-like permease